MSLHVYNPSLNEDYEVLTESEIERLQWQEDVTTDFETGRLPVVCDICKIENPHGLTGIGGRQVGSECEDIAQDLLRIENQRTMAKAETQMLYRTWGRTYWDAINGHAYCPECQCNKSGYADMENGRTEACQLYACVCHDIAVELA